MVPGMEKRRIPALTVGSIQNILDGREAENTEKPIVQILDWIPMHGRGDPERFRLLVSDGKHLDSFVILGCNLNYKLSSLTKFTIVQINRWKTTLFTIPGRSNKRVIFLLDIEVLVPGMEVGEKIGQPYQYMDEASQNSAIEASTNYRNPKANLRVDQPAKQPSTAPSFGKSETCATTVIVSTNSQCATASSFGNSERRATTVVAGLNPQPATALSFGNSEMRATSVIVSTNSHRDTASSFGKSDMRCTTVVAGVNPQPATASSFGNSERRATTVVAGVNQQPATASSFGNSEMCATSVIVSTNLQRATAPSFQKSDMRCTTVVAGVNPQPATAPFFGKSAMRATCVIASLNPYHNHWTIKARCSSKTPIKTWSNPRGVGKLFALDLLDESGEIRCTGFTETVDKFFDKLQVGKVYFISNCQIKNSNKQYTQIKHNYELVLKSASIVVPCSEACSVPAIKYKFVTIDEIGSFPDAYTLDIIGVCSQQSDLFSSTSKGGRDFLKRDITIVDESRTSAVLTLWAEQARDFDGSARPVVAVKNAQVRQIGAAKTVTTGHSSQVLVNPDIPRAHRLRGWYDCVGFKQQFASPFPLARGDEWMNGEWKTLRQVKDLRLEGQMTEYCLVKATVIDSKNEKCIYKACPNGDCNKKLIDYQNGRYRCEKCNKIYDRFKYGLLTRVNLSDHTGNLFANAFQEQSEEILSKTAQALGELETSDPNAYEKVFTNSSYKTFVFKLRVKMEMYNDVPAIKAVVVAVKKPIPFRLYNARLAAKLQHMYGVKKPHAP